MGSTPHPHWPPLGIYCVSLGPKRSEGVTLTPSRVGNFGRGIPPIGPRALSTLMIPNLEIHLRTYAKIHLEIKAESGTKLSIDED